MPRFFFDIHDVVDFVDEVGVELPDLLTVRSEVARTLARTAFEILPGDGPSKEFAIEVKDEGARVVLRAWLTFSTEPKF
jgi:hypothetical protein